MLASQLLLVDVAGVSVYADSSPNSPISLRLDLWAQVRSHVDARTASKRLHGISESSVASRNELEYSAINMMDCIKRIPFRRYQNITNTPDT